MPKKIEIDVRQREAVEHVAGPMLVVAGAGTGKTTVLTKRIANLIRHGHATPTDILALTYTNNSAQEMRDRVRTELPNVDVSALEATTFHDYCLCLLRRHGKAFNVVDEKDLWIMLRRRLPELELRHFVRAAKVSEFLQDLLQFLQRCQDELVGPIQYREYVGKLERGELPWPRVSKSAERDELSQDETFSRCREIAFVFEKVDEMLQERNLGTFGDMISGAYALLSSDRAVLENERLRARYVLVDEFQDANVAQIKIIQLLAGPRGNVFAVGDPDQAIYRFRGATSAAFTLFTKAFPDSRMVRLEKNRRSTTPILQSAYSAIRCNPQQIPLSEDATWIQQRKALVSARDEDAAPSRREPVDVVTANNQAECADIVGELKNKRAQSGCRWRDFAVLYRTRLHGLELAAELAQQGIPFSVENMDVMDTPQVRDLVACLRAVVSNGDSISLLRVAALPQFDIRPQELQAKIRSLPRDPDPENPDKRSMRQALSGVAGGERVLQVVEAARSAIAHPEVKIHRALEIAAAKFNLDLSSAPVCALLVFAKQWEAKPLTLTGSAGEFVEYLDYYREAGGMVCLSVAEESDAVRLMTVHGAKGLEFKHVFVIRVCKGSFPVSYREPLFEFPRDLRNDASLDDFDDKALSEQEDRRIFYVAMTRARDTLTLYGTTGRGKDKTPPGYLRELLGVAGLSQYLRPRPASGFQTTMFAESALEACASRTAEWVSLPPGSDLSARVSASSLQSYKRCPLQFKLEREWKLPQEVPGAMQFGASVHRVLRDYFDSVRLERPMAVDAVIQAFRDDLTNARLQDPYQHQLYEKQGVAQLEEFFRGLASGLQPQVLHTEEGFEIPLAGTLVTGRIDRIDREPDGSVAITDYKTGRPQTQEDADESLQLSIYALAAREKWGYRADRLVLHNLDGNQMVATSRSESQLDEVKKSIAETVAKIAQGSFRATPGFHCSFCAYQNLCPAKERKFYKIESTRLAN